MLLLPNSRRPTVRSRSLGIHLGCVLTLSLCLHTALAAANPTFPSAKVRRILFVGDSITFAGHYVAMVDTHLRLARPDANYHIVNIGLPSETCTGLSEPDHPFPRPNVHERLDRALTKFRPDAVVACYGMNDGIYYPFDEGRFAAYRQGIRRLIEKVKLAGAKLVLMTPPPFDPLPLRKKGALRPAGSEKFAWFAIYEDYDDVIGRYADWIMEQHELVDHVIDLRTPVLQYVSERRKKDPEFTMSPDGVHLNVEGHTVLANTILTAWGHKPRFAKARAVLKLVEQREVLLRDAWLSHIGHTRPGVKPGLSLSDAEAKAGEMQKRIEGLVHVGVSRVDITPRQPVHLINELGPSELAGVSQRLFARAIAFGSDTQGPAVLISFDGIGVPGQLTDEVARRLSAAARIPRERLVVCATHTHWAPHLSKLLPTIYGESLPEDQQRRVDRYTSQLTDWIELAALQALEDRQPRRLSWAIGKLSFAANRRLEEGGRLVTGEKLMFTYNPQAPIDHRFPVLYVHEPDGALRSVLFSYACHNVSLTLRDFIDFRNMVHGDWAGLAQEQIEKDHPGTVAIATIGCGGDQRPSPVGGLEVAVAQAREVANEVDLLLAASEIRRPLYSSPDGRLERITLPLTELPSLATLREFATSDVKGRNAAARGFLARQMLNRLDRGEHVEPSLPYTVQTWKFGDELAWVFLAGEVVVDYALRIGQEFSRDRVWSLAYANATPCYIPSRRVLERGGYEAATSMHYYGFLRHLTAEAEDLIIDSVHRQLPTAFSSRQEQSHLPRANRRATLSGLRTSAASDRKGIEQTISATVPPET